MSLSRF